MSPQDDFERLWKRYEPNLEKLAALLTRGWGAEVKEELLQEVRIQTFKRLGQYDRERPWGNWVVRIMQRKWLDVRGRLQRRFREVSFDGAEVGEEELRLMAREEPEFCRIETIDLIVDALKDWDPLLAADFILRNGYGYTIDEAAVALGFEPNVLRKLLDRRRRAALAGTERRRASK